MPYLIAALILISATFVVSLFLYSLTLLNEQRRQERRHHQERPDSIFQSIRLFSNLIELIVYMTNSTQPKREVQRTTQYPRRRCYHPAELCQPVNPSNVQKIRRLRRAQRPCCGQHGVEKRKQRSSPSPFSSVSFQ